jgi:hypothetical protein
MTPSASPDSSMGYLIEAFKLVSRQFASAVRGGRGSAAAEASAGSAIKHFIGSHFSIRGRFSVPLELYSSSDGTELQFHFEEQSG